MAEGNQSPPKAEVDDSPLQQSMDRNKESLKLKLLLRRPYPQLAAQGLVPPQKTPPAYHEQAKQLERRKTGDLLKAKIQQRPNREELVRQHILEDIGHVDPSLAERQRMLKKARLADQLNDQLSHRPGPLELIQKNILHTEEPIERAVKEGHIPFKATCEGQLTKPQHPDHYITFEDDSQSSEGGAPSPPQEAPGSSSSTSAAASATTVTTATPGATPGPGAAAEPAAAATATTTSSTTSAAPTSASGAGIAEAVPASGDVLETAATSAGIVVSLSIPTSDGAAAAAVVVTSSSPVFQKQQASGPQQSQPGLLGQAAGPEAPAMQSFAELCNSVAAGQELQGQQQAQHVTAQVAADSPLLISIASPASSMSSTTTLLPLAPAPSPMSLGSTTSSLSPLSNISIASPPAPPAAITPRPQPSPIAAAATSAGQQQQQRSDAPGKDKNRKKSKTKSQPKTRTIKFHEYKGPPNAQKSGASSSTTGLGSAHQGETSYELLLQQQQLFLQWQVEINNKGSGPIHQPRMFPQLILPAQNKIPLTANSSVASDSGSIVSVPSPASSNASSNPSEQPPLRPLGKLEDMKVSDLKVELKRRNLPVSGSKPQLIERLKPFTETSNNNMGSGTNVTQMGHILMDVPAPMSTDESNSHKGPNSPKDESMTSPRTGSPHGSEKEESSSPPGDVMLKEHYRKKIEELQRELLKVRSQQQFHQLQQNQPVRAEKLVLQQHLQNKMHQQQLTRQIQRLHQQQVQHQQQQQQQHQQQQAQQQAQQLAAFQQLNAKASLAAFLQAQPNNATATAIFDSATLTAINNKKNQSKSNGTTTTVQVPTAIVLNLAKPTKINGSILNALVAAQAQSNQHIVASAEDGKPPPPQYDEAAKLVKVKIEPLQKDPVKSQMVDDVLEILINSGELPPSAAHEPVTPTTPSRQIAPSLVLSAPADSPTQSLVFTAAPSPMDVTQSDCGSPAPQAQAAVAPPPPPPLPLPTFSIQLPSALQQQQQQQRQQQDKLTSFTADLLSSDSDLESAMLLSPQSVQQGSPDPQPPQEVTSTNLDLRELGLDLDTMDFGQLDCDFGVKMETPQEFMDIGDMPMDMDEPDWLESLMPQSPGASVSASATSTALTTTTTTTSSNSESASISTSQNTSASSPQASSNDLYDPLLGNSQDPFDLFNIEDPDFKMTSDLSLPWDNGQVDFAT